MVAMVKPFVYLPSWLVGLWDVRSIRNRKALPQLSIQFHRDGTYQFWLPDQRMEASNPERRWFAEDGVILTYEPGNPDPPELLLGIGAISPKRRRMVCVIHDRWTPRKAQFLLTKV